MSSIEMELLQCLRAHGYNVTLGKGLLEPKKKPLRWETPKAFCARVGIHGVTLIKALANPHCPAVTLDRARAGKGRLRYLSSNPAFERFVTRGKGLR